MNRPPAPRRSAALAAGHVHPEAFMLMTYATEDRSVVERIWNSRDGVTPFIVFSRAGEEMRHIDWYRDEYRPDYEPKAGERIFADLTPAVAAEYARVVVERNWEHPTYPMSRMYATKEEAIAELSKFQPGEPMLVEVPS